MGAGSTFSGISPMSRSADDALSRYCRGDLITTSVMTVSPGQCAGLASANHNSRKNDHELGGSKMETGFAHNAISV